jgi:predicted DNA-binding transcriptional regulator AlpA
MIEFSHLPTALADAALVNAETAARVGAMSVSWWHDAVRCGRAPQPVLQAVRCTRWRAADVRRFWLELAGTDPAVTARAAAASAKAQIKRQQSRAA